MSTKPIGTGAFKFVSYTPGDRLVLARNPDYFEPGKPKLDGVELRIIPEMSVKLAALQSGDIDVVWDLPLDQVKRSSRQARAARGKRRQRLVGCGDHEQRRPAPFNDKRVRLAFQLAVDKADVVELTLFGQGAPTISPIPPTHPFYATTFRSRTRTPRAARKLLAEAGHPNGVSVPIIVPTGRAGARAARRYVAAACQAGRVRSAGAARAIQSRTPRRCRARRRFISTAISRGRQWTRSTFPFLR